MENLSSGQTLLFLTVLLVITLLILYVIIKAAVKDGMKETHQLLRNIGNLKIQELKKDGFTDQEIHNIITPK
jgi:hypothetical protein